VSDSGITIDTNTALRVCMTAVGRSDTNTGYASYRVEGMFKREAGNVVAIGSPVSTIIAQDGDGTATSLVFGIMNPDTVVAIIIGHGSNNYNWAVTLEWQAVKNSA
jgi:diacylglycerol kinase family enzyme